MRLPAPAARSADRVVLVEDFDAAVVAVEHPRTGDVDPDVVTLDQVSARTGEAEAGADDDSAADHVPGRRRCSTHDDVVGDMADALAARNGQVEGARDVGADEIAGDEPVGNLGLPVPELNLHSSIGAAGDEVARCRDGPPIRGFDPP